VECCHGEARDLNQKGIDAYSSASYETAATFFQEALDKLPGDSTIHQNLQTARNQIAAKKRNAPGADVGVMKVERSA
jgi:hypothetical protein